jgi:hypothetical protein
MKDSVNALCASVERLRPSDISATSTPPDAAIDLKPAVKRLVGILVDQSGLSFHTAWVLAYHELFKRTGFHAVTACKGNGVILDAVERAGKMGELQQAVIQMLQSPEYAKNK